MRVKVLLATIVAIASISVSFLGNVREFASEQLGLVLPFGDSEAKAQHGPSESEGEHAEHTDGEHHATHGGNEAHGEHGEHAEGEGHHPVHKVVVTSPVSKDVTLTEQYVCRIRSRKHIDVKALEGGYLKEIKVNEGQAVKEGELMFHLLPTLYQARLEADLAEAQLAEVEYNNTKKLVDQGIVSDQELKLAKAKLNKAQAKVSLAKAELGFADIKAPFDGIIDRLYEQQGSLIEEGAMLTTLSDNSVMWVYFYVPEARYLEYQESIQNDPNQNNLDVRLKLANHNEFPQQGRIGAIEADFDYETGNIPFRADFPNPNGLLRNGQTGTILIDHVVHNAIVIPQRATYEILAKKYAYVIDEEGIVRQREITIQNELDDIYLISKGLSPSDKIVLEGIRQVRDGDKVEFEYQNPEEVLSNLKYHAE